MLVACCSTGAADVGCSPSTRFQAIALRGALTSFLRHAQSRDSRLQFCPADQWELPAVNSAVTGGLLSQPTVAEFEADEASELDIFRRERRLIRLLKRLPFVANFVTRAEVLRRVVRNDRERLFGQQGGIWGRMPTATIRRTHMYQDAFDKLNPMGKELRGRVRVSLVNEQGLDEAGIDGGGLFREFLQDILKLGFGK